MDPYVIVVARGGVSGRNPCMQPEAILAERYATYEAAAAVLPPSTRQRAYWPAFESMWTHLPEIART